jgi:hypothetical protein
MIMFRVQFTKSQLFRLKHEVLQEMHNFGYDGDELRFNAFAALLNALEQDQAGTVRVTRQQLLWLKYLILVEMEQLQFDDQEPKCPVLAATLQALDTAEEEK